MKTQQPTNTGSSRALAVFPGDRAVAWESWLATTAQYLIELGIITPRKKFTQCEVRLPLTTNSEPVFKCSHASCRTPLGDATGTLTIDTTHSMPFKPTFLSTPPQLGVWSPHQLLMEAGSLAFWKPSLLHFPCPHCHCFSEPLLPYTVHGFAPKTFYLGSPYIHPHTEKLIFLRIMSKTSKTHSLAGPLRPAYLGHSTSVPSN